jgi:hypothetical protein
VRLAVVFFAGTIGVRCAPNVPPIRVSPTSAEWGVARRSLAALRASDPAAPYTIRVAASMRSGDGKIAVDARGAIAVSPGRALRVILVGPGGATAFDGWVTPAAWRLDVPALSLVRRGGAEPSGTPVGFFRWWFLAPMAGELLTADERADGDEYLLLADGASVRVRVASRNGAMTIAARRVKEEHREDVTWTGRSLAPSAGDRASYVDEVSGLRVDVRVEAVEPEAPSPDAFVDPDTVPQ